MLTPTETRPGIADGELTHQVLVLPVADLELTHPATAQRFRQRPIGQRVCQSGPIIGELGFVPLSPTGAELLFEVFSQRCERGSLLVTTNLPLTSGLTCSDQSGLPGLSSDDSEKPISGYHVMAQGARIPWAIPIAGWRPLVGPSPKFTLL